MNTKYKKNIIILIFIIIFSNSITYFFSNKQNYQKLKQTLQIFTNFNPYIEQFNNKEVIVIPNPIDSNTSMLWLDNDFTKNNSPGPSFQKEQKKEVLKYILEKGKGVIDCGAHIGDFGICLAVILKTLKRNDIIVYCIEPSKEKCNFMKKVCKLNNLDETNIKIINCGLSDKIGKYSIGSKQRDGKRY